ncbi:hypothetical protein SLS62_006970 [Diatrype stigma]|uniref:Uncharacterized protein n=1 Tax=Diatrype stigma TaxID=117547 RepID=A0AAN9UMJ6_9PEZI
MGPKYQYYVPKTYSVKLPNLPVINTVRMRDVKPKELFTAKPGDAIDKFTGSSYHQVYSPQLGTGLFHQQNKHKTMDEIDWKAMQVGVTGRDKEKQMSLSLEALKAATPTEHVRINHDD